MQAGISNNNLRYHYERTTDPAGDYPVIKNQGRQQAHDLGFLTKSQRKFRCMEQSPKAFSPPTLAEILPSAGQFTVNLKPEYGWNYEAGLKGAVLNNRVEFNASFYYFELKDAIVRRVNQIGADYFVNAGGTIQKVWRFGLTATSSTAAAVLSGR